MKHTIRYSRLALLALAGSACIATTAHAQAFTDAQKAELQTLFKEYIMNNPTVLLDSVDQHRQNEEKKTEQSAQDALKSYKDFFANKSLPMAGNKDGDVTIVEYFDYNCGYCKKAFEDVQAIIKEDKNVRVVLQELPILSPSSQTMAALAEAAHKQGKYFEMHTALMNHRGAQTEEAFLETAKSIGLDTAKLKTDAASQEVQDAIAKSSEMAAALGIRGTPGFIVGDKIFPGYIGLDALKNAVAEARKAKAAETPAAPAKAE